MLLSHDHKGPHRRLPVAAAQAHGKEAHQRSFFEEVKHPVGYVDDNPVLDDAGNDLAVREGEMHIDLALVLGLDPVFLGDDLPVEAHFGPYRTRQSPFFVG